jgi:hypothetical protein
MIGKQVARLENAFKPDWLRLPRGGTHCPYTGLTRTAMDQLVRAQECNNFRPPVVSKILRAKGQRRGIRLISYESLIAYLNNLPIEAEQATL